MRDTPHVLPALAPARSLAAAAGAVPWGGFLLLHARAGVLHVKLTGALSRERLAQLDQAVRRACRGDATTFVLLDASALSHIPLPVASALLARERGWRQLAAVTVWVRPTAYIIRLLDLAGGTERLPVLPDFQSAHRVLRWLAGQPSGTARGKLEAWSATVH